MGRLGQKASRLPPTAVPRRDPPQSPWRAAALEHVPARTVLLREGDIAESLLVLHSGLVEIFTSSDGVDTTVLLVQPGSCLLAGPVLRQEPLIASARTVRPSRVFRLAAGEVRRRIDTDREFAGFIMNELASVHDVLLSELKSLRTKTAMQRLMLWIVAMHGRARGGSEIDLPYRKSLLAARLGMAPETLSRNLARLATVGVFIRGRRLTVSDAARLRQLARSRNAAEHS
jgi:CRP/FNR family transcriptional activator FtrB